MRSIALKDIAITVLMIWERVTVALRTVYWRFTDWSYRRQFRG
jgi:hypothetical protein